jgi:hypothetical protein
MTAMPRSALKTPVYPVFYLYLMFFIVLFHCSNVIFIAPTSLSEKEEKKARPETRLLSAFEPAEEGYAL